MILLPQSRRLAVQGGSMIILPQQSHRVSLFLALAYCLSFISELYMSPYEPFAGPGLAQYRDVKQYYDTVPNGNSPLQIHVKAASSWHAEQGGDPRQSRDRGIHFDCCLG